MKTRIVLIALSVVVALACLGVLAQAAPNKAKTNGAVKYDLCYTKGLIKKLPLEKGAPVKEVVVGWAIANRPADGRLIMQVHLDDAYYAKSYVGAESLPIELWVYMIKVKTPVKIRLAKILPNHKGKASAHAELSASLAHKYLDSAKCDSICIVVTKDKPKEWYTTQKMPPLRN